MTYPGGKNGAGTYQKIINQMPAHQTYIEAFLGGGAIMRLKRPAVASIGIDSDDDVLRKNWRGDEVPNLELLNTDAIDFLADKINAYFGANTLIYLDPPYLMQTRSSQRPIYRHELTYVNHIRLLHVIKRLHCMVMISGYYSTLYARALKGWRSIQFQAQTRSGRSATEWLWMNFPEPLELHDYRYLGENFRQRERIKRKRSRWLNRLRRMDSLERHAMMMALKDFGSATPEIAMPAIGAPIAGADDATAGSIALNGDG